MMVINNGSEVDRSVTQDVVPETEREGGCIALRDETFVCSFKVMDIDAPEYKDFLGDAEVV